MRITTLFAVSAFALTLSACGNAQDAAQSETVTARAEMPMDMAGSNTMDHSGHDMNKHGGDDSIGHGTGIIKSFGAQGDFLTIAHGPIEGVGMDAMTMGFDIMGDVDLSGFSDGDEVAFMVKQGRDGSYRIMAICNTATEGAECLDGMMDE